MKCGDLSTKVLKTKNLSYLLDHKIVKYINVKLAYTLENQSFSDYNPTFLELYTTNTSVTLSKGT